MERDLTDAVFEISNVRFPNVADISYVHLGHAKFRIPANFINGGCGGMLGRGLEWFHWGSAIGGVIDLSLGIKNQI